MSTHQLMFATLAGACLFAFTATSHAETISFTVPESFAGGSVNGFTFSDNWKNYGQDSRNAPFMEFFDQAHSLTYDAGTFDFYSISLGGWPWDDYGLIDGNSTVTMEFLDMDGNLIESNQIILALDNTYQSFSKPISGVHEILFQPMGGDMNGEWVNGSWPRLDSITINAVPEAETYAMMLAGLGVLIALTKHRNRQA